MDFEQFKENLTKDVKACFDDRTGANNSVETHKVDKMNYSYEAMVVKPEGSDVGVSIDVNNLYEAYQNSASTQRYAKESSALRSRCGYQRILR